MMEFLAGWLAMGGLWLAWSVLRWALRTDERLIRLEHEVERIDGRTKP